MYVWYLRLWVEEKTQPVQVAMGETTAGARGIFVPTAEGETPLPLLPAQYEYMVVCSAWGKEVP